MQRAWGGRVGRRIYDVTARLWSGMPTYDGEPGPERHLIKQLVPDGVEVSTIRLSVHAGTHVDAPRHVIADGAAVDELPLDALLGRATVIELAGDTHISRADLQAAVPPGTERLLLKTPNSALWDDPRFRTDFVGLRPEAAEWLVQQHVRLVGIDYYSIDPYTADPLAAHLRLLGAGVVVVEGLDMRGVPPGDYHLACLPLKLAGADGAPARVVLSTKTPLGLSGG